MSELFWSKVDKTGPVPEHRPELGGCWVWTGGKDRDGYGRFGRGKISRVHRIAFVESGGEIMPGMHVCHACDNPACVRASHLFSGSTQENTADRVRKGRSAKGDANGARLYPERIPRRKGMASPVAKLSDADVLEIRRIYREQRPRQKDLGRQFSVDGSLISLIVNRRLWSHI